MLKKIWIIVPVLLIISILGLGAHAFLERDIAGSPSEENLEDLIQDSMCQSRE